jgi:hypothetical protein
MPPLTPLDTDDLRRRHAEGQSVLQMARELGVQRRTIDIYLRRLGPEARSASEANRLRMARMTPEERRADAAAAHAARRTGGSRERDTFTPGQIEKARVAERDLSYAQPDESLVAALYPQFRRQVAVGPYNLDFLVGNVAVEVHSSNTHPLYHPNLAHRTEQLLGAGFHVGYLWPYGERGCHDLIAWAQQVSLDVPLGGQYRVVRGHGEVASVDEAQMHAAAMRHMARDRQYALPSPADLR